MHVLKHGPSRIIFLQIVFNQERVTKNIIVDKCLLNIPEKTIHGILFYTSRFNLKHHHIFAASVCD